MKKNLVSVIVRTHNHEDCIAQTIESILWQETNFDFEIIICDESSTDGTFEIIKTYEKKNPEKIKVFLKQEKIETEGKYIALCNGGEVWTNPFKLKVQLGMIEQHPELDICVHGACVVIGEIGTVTRRIQPKKYNSVLSLEQIIEGGEGYVAEGSIFYRANIDKDIPEFRKECPNDFALLIHGALRGGALYVNDNMLSTRRKKKAPDEINNVHKNINMLDKLNEYTNGQYSEAINIQKLNYEFRALVLNKNFKEMKSEKYRELYKKLSLNNKIHAYRER